MHRSPSQKTLSLGILVILLAAILLGAVVASRTHPRTSPLAAKPQSSSPANLIPAVAELTRREVASVPVATPEPVVVAPPVVPEPIRPRPYVSLEIDLTETPHIVEFVVKTPESDKPVVVRGVAISYDGKILTLDSYFVSKSTLLSAVSLNEDAKCYGWLARDEANGWRIVKSKMGRCVPAQIVHRNYTQFSASEELLLPLPTPENPFTARTMKPVPAPEGAASDPHGEGFWITGSLRDVVPGTPVLNKQNYLVGLIDDIRGDTELAHVRRVSGPFTLLNEAISRLRVLDWNEVPVEENIDWAFTKAGIDGKAVAEVKETLAGEALTEASKKLIDRYPESAQVWYAVSAGYARDGRVEYATASAKMLTQFAPKKWESWFILGQRLEAGKQFGQALDAYQAASESNAPLRRLGVPMARCLFASGDASGGREMLRRVLENDTDNFAAWLTLGGAQREAGQLDEAVKSFTQAASINPQAPEAWQALGEAYDAGQNSTAAVRAYKQFTLLQPGNSRAWNQLGVALVKTNQESIARVSFRKAIQLNPEDNVAKKYLAQLDHSVINETQSK